MNTKLPRTAIVLGVALTLVLPVALTVRAGTSGQEEGAAGASKKAVVGVVESVDETSRTIAVKTADGAVVTAEYTKETSVAVASRAADGAETLADAGKDVAWASMKGANVVMKYSEKAGKRTADAVQDFGDEVPEVVEGTVESVSDGGRTVAIRTKDGAVTVYEVGKDTSVSTSRKVKKGAKVVAAVTTRAAKKVAHVFKWK